jgi:hypothetical protein
MTEKTALAIGFGFGLGFTFPQGRDGQNGAIPLARMNQCRILILAFDVCSLVNSIFLFAESESVVCCLANRSTHWGQYIQILRLVAIRKE